MVERTYAPKEIIYREGDTPDVTFVILAGRVELLKASGREDIVTSTLDEGAAFGEEALLSDVTSRSYSARALEPCKMQVLTPTDFEHLMSQSPKPIQSLLYAFARHATKPATGVARASGKPAETAQISVGDIKEITISPASDLTKKLIHPATFPTARLPLTIGGFQADSEEAPTHQNHVHIPSEGPPLKVSKHHCEIIGENEVISLIDVGSRFGTIVNGKLIGRGSGSYSVPLQKGDNEVTLGGKQSQYKITITLA